MRSFRGVGSLLVGALLFVGPRIVSAETITYSNVPSGSSTVDFEGAVGPQGFVVLPQSLGAVGFSVVQGGAAMYIVGDELLGGGYASKPTSDFVQGGSTQALKITPPPGTTEAGAEFGDIVGGSSFDGSISVETVSGGGAAFSISRETLFPHFSGVRVAGGQIKSVTFRFSQNGALDNFRWSSGAVAAHCGDGIVDPTEACDYLANPSGCSSGSLCSNACSCGSCASSGPSALATASQELSCGCPTPACDPDCAPGHGLGGCADIRCCVAWANCQQDLDKGARTQALAACELLLGGSRIPNTPVCGMSTGSPVSLSQIVNVPTNPTQVAFDYYFSRTSGTLRVTLEGQLLARVEAPTQMASSLTRGSYAVPQWLLGHSGSILKFELDGPSESPLFIDNIAFPGLINGSFSTGDLSGFSFQTADNNGYVAAVGANTPAPSTPVPAASDATVAVLLLLLLLVGAGVAWTERRSLARSP